MGPDYRKKKHFNPFITEDDERKTVEAQTINGSKKGSHDQQLQSASSLHSTLGALVGISMTVTIILIIINVKRGVNFGIDRGTVKYDTVSDSAA